MQGVYIILKALFNKGISNMNRFIFTMAMMKQIYLSWELKFCVSVKLGHEVVCDSRPRRSTFHRISSAGSTASHRVVCSVCVDYWFASRPGPKASGKYLLPWLFVVVSGSGPRESGLERAPISLICLALRLHLAFIFTLAPFAAPPTLFRSVFV